MTQPYFGLEDLRGYKMQPIFDRTVEGIEKAANQRIDFLKDELFETEIQLIAARYIIRELLPYIGYYTERNPLNNKVIQIANSRRDRAMEFLSK